MAGGQSAAHRHGRPLEPAATTAQQKDEKVEHYDVAVIGGGVTGLAAALLLTRAHRKIEVIDDGHPRNAPAEHSRGYLTRDGENPSELIRHGRTEVRGYGAELIDAAVSRIDAERTIELADGRKLQATRVLVATGIEDVLRDIPGVQKGWGREVLHCPYCHADDAGGGSFVVLGTHPGAVAPRHPLDSTGR